jgi:hypothetical protein
LLTLVYTSLWTGFFVIVQHRTGAQRFEVRDEIVIELFIAGTKFDSVIRQR